MFIILSLSVDIFVMSFSYGISKIKIQLKTILLISFTTTLVLVLSASVSNILAVYVNQTYMKIFSISVLSLLGFIKLFNYSFKKIIIKFNNKVIKIFNIKIILEILSDNTLADIDKSKDLSLKEAMYLSFALSVDSLSAGLTLSLFNQNIFFITTITFLISLTLLTVGNLIGKKLFKKNLNLDWLSGVTLISIALLKFL